MQIHSLSKRRGWLLRLVRKYICKQGMNLCTTTYVKILKLEKLIM